MSWPTQGQDPWGDDLHVYVDSGDAAAEAGAVATASADATTKANNAQAAAVAAAATDATTKANNAQTAAVAAAGTDATNKANLRAPSGLPAYVATPRSNAFDRRNSAYNWKASNTRRTHAALGKAATGLGLASIGVLGDSLSMGANSGTAFDRLNSWPLAMRKKMALAGIPVAGDGVICAGTWPATTPAAVDPRLTISAGWTNNGGYLSSTNNGETIKCITTQASTVVSFFYFDNSTASMTVSIDGGAPVAVTRTGNFAIVNYRVTGLANTVHTIVVTQTSTGNAYAVGFGSSSATGLLVHNLGVYGSKAQDWASDTTDPTGSYLANRTMMGLSAAPQTVFIELMANDLAAVTAGTRTLAQVKADLQTIIGFYSGSADIVLIAPTQAGSTAVNTLEPAISMLYDLADQYDCPLIDWYDRTGGYTNANANGLMGTDGTHLTIAAYSDFGALAATLATPVGGSGTATSTSTPSLLLENGAAVPAGTAIGTIIYMKKAPATVTNFKGLSALPAGWVRRGISSETYAADGMSAVLAAGQGWYYDLGAASDGTFEVKFVSNSNDAAMMSATLTSTAGSGGGSCWYTSPSGNLAISLNAWAYNSTFTNGGGTPAYPSRLRIRKAGTSYYASYSTDDGATWSTEAAEAGLASAAQYIGIIAVLNGTTVKVAEAKWYAGSINAGGIKGWWDGSVIQAFS